MSQTNALVNANTRNFVVVSVDTNGYFSMSTRPMFHTTVEAAVTECARLAQAAPGKAYIACQLRGGALVPSGVQTF